MGLYYMEQKLKFHCEITKPVSETSLSSDNPPPKDPIKKGRF